MIERQDKGLANSLGIYDREKCLEIFASDVVQRNDSTQMFMIANAELRKIVIEVSRVAKEVSMDTIKCAINL